MKKIIALMMAAALLLCGCGAAETAGETFPVLENNGTIGTGATSFTLSIVDGENSQIDVTVNTDKEFVGEALQELHIIFGTMGEYGLYIEKVNGVSANYEEDGTYWAFYVDGEYAEQSADLTPVKEGSVYMLRIETV